MNRVGLSACPSVNDSSSIKHVRIVLWISNSGVRNRDPPSLFFNKIYAKVVSAPRSRHGSISFLNQ